VDAVEDVTQRATEIRARATLSCIEMRLRHNMPASTTSATMKIDEQHRRHWDAESAIDKCRAAILGVHNSKKPGMTVWLSNAETRVSISHFVRRRWRNTRLPSRTSTRGAGFTRGIQTSLTRGAGSADGGELGIEPTSSYTSSSARTSDRPRAPLSLNFSVARRLQIHL